MTFQRLRRLRLNEPLRNLRRETEVQKKDLIMPVFVHEGISSPVEVPSMPGIYQYDLNSAMEEIQSIEKLGLAGAILFGIPKEKDETATGAWVDDGIVQTALRKTKEAGLSLPVIADTCLCEYTSHGHCGPLDKNQNVDNDSTLEWLAKTAVSQARAGADIIAPSTMIDGMISTLRKALDSEGFNNTPILSYGAKFASQFYGPFRDAAGSGDHFSGDRKNHQMDPANGREAQLELQHDALEGADLLMVKPAMAYLDVISHARQWGLPVWAYNVSGEYSMVKASAQAGHCDEKNMTREILSCIKRAGADRIITYHAKDFASSS